MDEALYGPTLARQDGVAVFLLLLLFFFACWMSPDYIFSPDTQEFLLQALAHHYVLQRRGLLMGPPPR